MVHLLIDAAYNMHMSQRRARVRHLRQLVKHRKCSGNLSSIANVIAIVIIAKKFLLLLTSSIANINAACITDTHRNLSRCLVVLCHLRVLLRVNECANTHKHKHRHTHTRAHTHTHARTRTDTDTDTDTDTHTCCSSNSVI